MIDQIESGLVPSLSKGRSNGVGTACWATTRPAKPSAFRATVKGFAALLRVFEQCSFPEMRPIRLRPFEQLLQVAAAEYDRRRPAVRAMVGVVRQLPLGQQFRDLGIRQPVAGPHGGVAGGQGGEVA